jgi:hypothetical protein
MDLLLHLLSQGSRLVVGTSSLTLLLVALLLAAKRLVKWVRVLPLTGIIGPCRWRLAEWRLGLSKRRPEINNKIRVDSVDFSWEATYSFPSVQY